jgi:hypothetical protein
MAMKITAAPNTHLGEPWSISQPNAGSQMCRRC